MIVDFIFAGDKGPENEGTITFENGKLTASNAYTQGIIDVPLQVTPRVVIDPKTDPERFIRSLPDAYRGSRFYARLRAEAVTVPISVGP